MKRTLVFALLATAAFASADLSLNFEAPAFAGSTTGTVVTGQGGFYIPPVGGTDGNVFTYAGNTPGFVTNPNGGEQFLVSAFANALNARSQIDMSFAAHDIWDLSYDIATLHLPGTAAVNNISSFSLQDNAVAKSFTALNTWVDVTNPTSWNAQYNVFDSAGVALNNQSAGAAWSGLNVNHWYRERTSFSLSQNRILQVSMTDLTTNVVTTVSPTGWYLTGGANSTLPNPTGVRFFGGGAVGNNTGWDNFQAVPEPMTCALLGLGALALRRRARKS